MSTSDVAGPGAKGIGLPDWIPLLAMIALLGAMVRQVARPLSDPDIWWHLRLGSDFWEGRSISSPGQFGPSSNAAWVPTQWLPEMVASKAADLFGLPAVAWLFGLALLSLVALLYFTNRREAGPMAASFATAVAVVGMSASLSPRPHMLTYIFLTITVTAWLQTSRDHQPRWWLIAMSWIWACSHGMWFVGALTGVVMVIGIGLDGRVRKMDLLKLVTVPVGCIGVAALTPAGPRLLTTPFAVEGISQFITEWAPPNFRELGPAATAAAIAIVVLAWSRGNKRPWSQLVLLLLAGGWTLLAARTVTLGAITVAPLLAGVIQTWLPTRAATKVPKAERMTIVAATALWLAALAFIVPHVSSEPAGVPLGLETELDRFPAGTVVLNSYNLGGWLLWAHPQLVPVVDGLTESYTPGYLLSYINATAAAPDWQDFVDETGATIALIEETRPISGTLQDQLGWVQIGSDRGFILLKAPPVG